MAEPASDRDRLICADRSHGSALKLQAHCLSLHPSKAAEDLVLLVAQKQAKGVSQEPRLYLFADVHNLGPGHTHILDHARARIQEAVAPEVSKLHPVGDALHNSATIVQRARLVTREKSARS